MENLEIAIKVFEFEAETLSSEIENFKKEQFICDAINAYQSYIKRNKLTGRELPKWNYIAECAINSAKSRLEPIKADIDFNNID